MKTTRSRHSDEIVTGRERSPVRLDPNARVPLYHQIFLILRNRIFGGEVQSGELVPGEQELAAEFNVSRITAKRALNEAHPDYPVPTIMTHQQCEALIGRLLPNSSAVG